MPELTTRSGRCTAASTACVWGVAAALMAAAGCGQVVDALRSLCITGQPEGSSQVTAVRVVNASQRSATLAVVPYSSGAECLTPAIQSAFAVPADLFLAGRLVAVQFLPTSPSPLVVDRPVLAGGQSDTRSLACEQLADAIVAGPAVWYDPSARRIIAYAPPLILYRHYSAHTDLSRLYQCGDEIVITTTAALELEAEVLRDGAAIAGDSQRGVQVPEVCGPTGPLDPAREGVFAVQWTQHFADATHATYQIQFQQGAFFMTRTDQIVFTLAGGTVLPGQPPPNPTIELSAATVQALMDALESACIYDLPADASGNGFLFANQPLGPQIVVGVTRGARTADLLIDDVALALDGRYGQIADALGAVASLFEQTVAAGGSAGGGLLP